MKSYTDIEQSKKLSEILPHESADMWYDNNGESIAGRPEVRCGSFVGLASINIPCWSLTSLLGILPNGIVMHKDSQNGRYHFSSTHVGTYVTADNPIDACYEMILKLHELNLL